MQVISSRRVLCLPTAIALGNFDGVHRGHLQVIQPILEAPTGHKTVVSFDPHPRAFFSGEQRLLLTPSDEKAQYLSTLGIEQLVLLPFDQALADLSPRDFVTTVLGAQLQVKHLSVGENFRFGRRRAGTAADLKAIAHDHGITVHITPLEVADHERISSSAIREALGDGDLTKANHLLGRPYALMGTVVHGQHLGRTLGFPTANLDVPSCKFVPRTGVYAAQAWPKGAGSAVPGVVNIGYRPTVQGTHRTIEVHLLDWSQDLYGQVLKVDLRHFLRAEQAFDSLDALKAQIERDCQLARLKV
ncbi:MAG: bifunctional riboflavin kinase/FAD synthetase [Elainellaceae cyanobacterium]